MPGLLIVVSRVSQGDLVIERVRRFLVELFGVAVDEQQIVGVKVVLAGGQEKGPNSLLDQSRPVPVVVGSLVHGVYQLFRKG